MNTSETGTLHNFLKISPPYILRYIAYRGSTLCQSLDIVMENDIAMT